MTQCETAIGTVEHLLANKINPCDGTSNRQLDVIVVAHCCREAGRIDLANHLLGLAESSTIAHQEPYKSQAIQLRQMIEQQCTEPLNKSQPIHEVVPVVPPELPPITIRGWNFATAMWRWAASGFKMCTQEEIDERLAICQACAYLTPANTCQLCGCQCDEKNQLLNKLAIASEKCPIDLWRAR